jgi:3-oxoacyl-[acyl-carrier protein] reductase
MFPEPRFYPPEELKVGLTAQFEREINEEDVISFARNSGDCNPLHVDLDYAEKTNFGGRIVHGAFQIGLASAMLGMYLPGRNSLLASMNARFKTPLYYPCRVQVKGEVVAWNLQRLSGTLRVLVQELPSRVPASEILSAFSLQEEKRTESPLPVSAPRLAVAGDRRTILVTGASGGIGAGIVADLARDYFVLAMVHRHPLGKSLSDLPNVTQFEADLSTRGWEERVASIIPNGSFYGIIHAAWPGEPRGGLLDAREDVVEQQVLFGSSSTIRLARLLFSRASAEGGRVVVLGSVAGSRKPAVGLAAYSLGKSTMEHTVKLLAPELARRKVTINAVCPTFIPVGMNMRANRPQLLRETALIPMGRLCGIEDALGLIRYLLSLEASFVSGEVIGVSGAQI